MKRDDETDNRPHILTDSVPTIKEYQGQSGYYIRSNIEGRFVTLQLSPRAEGLFSDLGYSDEDSVSWELLQPLCDAGHAYTNNSGTELSTDEVSSEDVSATTLSLKEKNRLNEFLEWEAGESNSTGDEKSSSDSVGNSGSVEDLDEGVRGLIENWSPSDDEYEGTINRIARSDNISSIAKSVRHHNTGHPIHIDRFRLSSQGIPTYSFHTLDIEWTVHDFRLIRQKGTSIDFFIDIQPGTEESQSITITPDSTEWHTSGEAFTPHQIDQYLTVLPDIWYYTEHLPSAESANLTEICENNAAQIPSSRSGLTEKVETLQNRDPEEFGRALGLILHLGEKGYGRVRAHTGETFPYSIEDVTGDVVEGDTVSLSIKHHRGQLYADEIHLEDGEVSTTAFRNNWPEGQNKTLEWVQENWVTESDFNPRGKETISLSDPNDTSDFTDVELMVDSLVLELAIDSDDPEELVDQSIRGLLKSSVDGVSNSPRDPITTTQITLRITENLLAMIDSVVNINSAYQHRGEFVNAALLDNIDASETSLSVEVPAGYEKAIHRISNEHEMSESEFVRLAIEKAIRRNI